MLEKFIKMQCKSFDDNRANFSENEEIQKVESQCAVLLSKLKELDENLGNEIDTLIGGIATIYGNIHFEAGFKDGIKLVKEIDKEVINDKNSNKL
jgi:hypothetical protein